MIEENNQNLNKKSNSRQSGASYWRPVMLFYAKTTSWVVFPLILAVLAGDYVSESVGSQVLFFIFIMLGFLITCLGIYREVKNYKKNLEANENSKISAPTPSELEGQGNHDA